MLRNSVKLNDSGSVEVVSDNGTPRYTEKGAPMQVNDLVAEYLNNNPHHLSATPSGSGSKSAIGGDTPKPISIKDLDMNNPKDREVYKKLRAERSQGGMKANLIIG